jgi:hypothetical protein
VKEILPDRRVVAEQLGHRKRLASVTQVVYLLLAALVVSNVMGIILVGVLR